MYIRLTGTGNAPQIPVYGCHCSACSRARVDENFRRRPASAEIQTASGRFLLDAGRTDLADWVDPKTLQGVILTHYHMDHVAGLFHLRWGVSEPIPVYGPADPNGCDDLHDHPGCLDFSHSLEAYTERKLCEELAVIPVPIKHSKMTFGYIIKGRREAIAYLSDCDGIGPESASMIRDAKPKAVIVDCSFPPGMGRNHLSLDRALPLLEELGAQWLYLTHIGHDLENHLIEHPLPQDGRVLLARDGLTLNID
jgi:phosphoribosyl 1,2-cyclic phosphate phosphodiesterase